MNLSEALDRFLKQASLNIPQEALDRAKELVSQVATNGANNQVSYNKVFSNNFTSVDEFLDFLNTTLRNEVKSYAPQMIGQIDFIKNLVTSSVPKSEKKLPTQKEIINWQISQVNQLKSKISDSKFMGFSEPDAKNLVSYVSSLVKNLNSFKQGSEEFNKISNLLDIVSGFSDDMFPEQLASQVQAMKASISNVLSAPKTIDEMSGINPEENSMDKLKLNEEHDAEYLPPEYKVNIPDSKFKNVDHKTILEPASPKTARINFIKRLIK